MRRNVLVSSTSSLVNGPPYLFFPRSINTTWNILLPVGEGTAMLRDLVLPRVLENFVDILEWIESSFLNVEVLFCSAKFSKYTAVTAIVITIREQTNFAFLKLLFRN